MKTISKIVALFIVVLAFDAFANTADGTIKSFKLHTDNTTCSLPAVLDGNLCIIVDGTERVDESKIRVRVDGTLLEIKPRVISNTRIVIFPLTFAGGKNADAVKDSRELWSRLLGSPFSDSQRVDVLFDVEFSGRALTFDAGDPKITQATFPLLRYEGVWMFLGFLLAAGAVVGVVYLGSGTSALRDRSPLPQLSASERPYSLGKFQMAVWFCLIFVSFIFIWAVTSEIGSVTSETFILLGISAGTALGAVAVDRAKDSPTAPAESELTAMGIRNAQDVKVLRQAQLMGGGSQPAQSHLLTAQPVNGVMPTVDQLVGMYERLTEPFRSTGFLRDLISDSSGATIHRFQMVAWTVLLGLVYVLRVYWNLQMPEFGTNLLTLMGISGGIYLGFKVPER